MQVDVVDDWEPSMSLGSRGTGECQFLQPSALTIEHVKSYDGRTSWLVYVLDCGNQRISKFDADPDNGALTFIEHVESPSLQGRGATGLCFSSMDDALWVANWKLKSVYKISSSDGNVLQTLSSPLFKEPVDVTMNSKGHLLIADAGCCTIFVATTSGDTSGTYSTLTRFVFIDTFMVMCSQVVTWS